MQSAGLTGPYGTRDHVTSNPVLLCLGSSWSKGTWGASWKTRSICEFCEIKSFSQTDPRSLHTRKFKNAADKICVGRRSEGCCHLIYKDYSVTLFNNHNCLSPAFIWLNGTLTHYKLTTTLLEEHEWCRCVSLWISERPITTYQPVQIVAAPNSNLFTVTMLQLKSDKGERRDGHCKWALKCQTILISSRGCCSILGTTLLVLWLHK